MGTHRIFLEKAAVEMEKVGMATRYSFWPETNRLEVYWKGKMCYQTKAYPGQAFVVCCHGRTPVVNELGIPEKKQDLIPWLLSYFKQSRAYSFREYEHLLEERRKSFDWWGYREWTIEGNHYSFTLCNRQDCSGVYHIACYVDEEVSKSELIDLFNDFGRGFYYPAHFVREILQKKLGFSEKEIKKIRAL